jgi:hypothetical protein
MAKARSSFLVARVFTPIAFVLVGSLLTGFFTVFLAKFLGHYVGSVIAVPLGVGLAVCLTLWFTQLLKQPPFMLSGTSPLVAGFFAGLGVHVSRVWL